MGSAVALEQELQAFERELPRLLQDPQNRDKFVLIHGDRVEGVWPTTEEALQAGYERFGLEPFLVKKITEHEKPLYFSRNIHRCR